MYMKRQIRAEAFIPTFLIFEEVSAIPSIANHRSFSNRSELNSSGPWSLDLREMVHSCTVACILSQGEAWMVLLSFGFVQHLDGGDCRPLAVPGRPWNTLITVLKWQLCNQHILVINEPMIL